MAENLGVKNAKWDKEDYFSNNARDCYNSYFYCVEDTTLTILDKIEMYNHDVGLEVEGLLIGFLLGVGAMSVVEQGSARMSEVAHLVAVAQHLLQPERVALRLTVGQSVAKGYAVADTGHAKTVAGRGRQ